MGTVGYIVLIAAVVGGILYITPFRTIHIPGLGILSTFGNLVDQTKEFFGSAKKSVVEAPQTVQEKIAHSSEVSLDALSDSANTLHGELQNKAADLLNLERPQNTALESIKINTGGFEVCTTLKKNENVVYEVRNPATPKQEFSVRAEWGDGKTSVVHATETDEKIALVHLYVGAGRYGNAFAITNASGTVTFQRNVCVD